MKHIFSCEREENMCSRMEGQAAAARRAAEREREVVHLREENAGDKEHTHMWMFLPTVHRAQLEEQIALHLGRPLAQKDFTTFHIPRRLGGWELRGLRATPEALRATQEYLAVSSPPQQNESGIHPEALLCPLTYQPMTDPVVDPEGNSYERSAIVEWLSRKQESPITRSPLGVAELIPNRALKALILHYTRDVMGSV